MAARQKRPARVVIDDRWGGQNGIGRFATEVFSRFTVPAISLGGRGRPASAIDVFTSRRWGLAAMDVLYSPGFNVGLTRARQLLTVHDLIHLHSSGGGSASRALYYRLLVRPAIKRCRVVLTASETSARAIRLWLGTSDVDVVVVGCGRSEVFSFEGPRRTFRAPTFVYVSSIRPHKNLEPLLDAFVLRPDFHLILVTSDVATADRLIEERGLRQQVTVESSVPDEALATLFRGSAGIIVPSLIEGFGLPALEAMSCGVRVAHWSGCESVAEICGATSVTVEDPMHGGAWAEALDGLKERGPLAATELPGDWDTRYSWSHVAQVVETVITRLAQGAAVRP